MVLRHKGGVPSADVLRKMAQHWCSGGGEVFPARATFWDKKIQWKNEKKKHKTHITRTHTQEAKKKQ